MNDKGMVHEECPDCCGTGIDGSAWDERCVTCRGRGQILVDPDEYWGDYDAPDSDEKPL